MMCKRARGSHNGACAGMMPFRSWPVGPPLARRTEAAMGLTHSTSQLQAPATAACHAWRTAEASPWQIRVYGFAWPLR